MSNPSLIPLPAPLRTTANLAVEWKRFHGQWKNYVKAAKIDKEDADRQAAIFLACVGSDAYDIYTTLEFESEDDKAKPDKLIEAFERHCVGEVNEIYERYIFNNRQQQPAGESFDTFVGDLRRLVKTCGYGTVEESTIRDRIVLGIRDDATRKKLLLTRTLDLTNALDICRSSEATMRQLKDMTSPAELKALRQQTARSSSPQRTSSRYRRRMTPGRYERHRSPSAERYDNVERRCKFCNGTHKPSKDLCKAYGATCAACGKKNHYASVCRSKRDNDRCDSLTEESLLSLHNGADKRCYANVLVDGHMVKFLLDTGSTANVLPAEVMTSLRRRLSDLKPSRSKLTMFDQTQLCTLGMLSAKLTHPRTKVELDANFYVAKTGTPVLGVDACRRLDIVRIVDDNLCEAHELPSQPSHPPSTDRPVPMPRRRSAVLTVGRITEAEIFDRNSDLFDGQLGIRDDEVHLEDDPKVFRPSSEMVLADTLSRAYPPAAATAQFPEELATLSTVDEDQMHGGRQNGCVARDNFPNHRRRTRR